LFKNNKKEVEVILKVRAVLIFLQSSAESQK
jgi:hypothetical protein